MTVAFCDPFVFFLGWLHTRMVPVMSLLVFFGALVASLQHSGFLLALGSWPPQFLFSSRHFFWRRD